MADFTQLAFFSPFALSLCRFRFSVVCCCLTHARGLPVRWLRLSRPRPSSLRRVTCRTLPLLQKLLLKCPLQPLRLCCSSLWSLLAAAAIKGPWRLRITRAGTVWRRFAATRRAPFPRLFVSPAAGRKARQAFPWTIFQRLSTPRWLS